MNKGFSSSPMPKGFNQKIKSDAGDSGDRNPLTKAQDELTIEQKRAIAIAKERKWRLEADDGSQRQ